MDKVFLDTETDYEKIVSSANDTNFNILAENNKDEIQKIMNFFASDNSLLFVTGFLGTGKTEIVKNIVNQADNDTVVLWANCYESTNLDDIFLVFFEKFKHLASSGIINIPQARFENFNQRINACFSAIQKNIIVVINSYQALMAENVKPINDFISYLTNFSNIKTIVISRNFNTAELPENVKFEKIVLKAFDESTFQKLLLNNKVKMYGPVADELYKLTKGYYFYLTLAIKIILAKNITVIDFIKDYSNSFMSMKEFLFQEVLKIVGNPNPHLIRFLTVIRCPVNAKLLNALNLYDEKFLQILADNMIIEIDHGNIYLKDYYKDMSGAEIPQNILNKIHKSCIELYELQLPRKPDDRDLLISRKTIRQEIEYHRIFVPKKYEPGTNSLAIYNSQPIIVKSQQLAQEQPENKPETPKAEPEQPKELKDILFVFNEEEEKSLMTGIAESISSFMENAKQQDNAENNMSDEELINLMNEAEDNFDYKKVINLGKKIIIRADANPDIKLYTAEKMALCYEKLSDIYNALKYCEMAKSYISESGNTFKILEYDFNIARLNYKIFKRDYAKEILLSLHKAQNPVIKIKSELLLFDIYLDEGDEEKAFESCKEALAHLDKNPDKELACELLFKCGLILDIRKNYLKAIDAYERSLKISSDSTNKYLIQTYNNLANLYSETENYEKAKEYSLTAFETAKSQNNNDEMFNSTLRLAELTKDDEKSALKLYEQALEYAKLANDTYCNITALIALGDFYFEKHKNLSALENYLKAYKIGKESFYDEIKTLLDNRLISVKAVLNYDVYYPKLKEYGYEET
ncbi:tetratricopeptide repeat protein [bacterium]|nr:tetratricopeptide repeat protein [bacterium]